MARPAAAEERAASVHRRAETTSGPNVRRIGVGDLKEVLARGLDDFRVRPSHLLFLGLIYPIATLILVVLTFGYDFLPLVFPLVAGLVLLGPFAAIGLYELSRRREMGQDIAWRHAFSVLRSSSRRTILALGAILTLIFFVWLGVAVALFEATLGTTPASLGDFIGDLFGTAAGWTLIVLGNAIGFLFALLVLAISAVSFPMLVDRKVSLGTAVGTSLAAFRVNPVPMAVWGLIVALSLLVGALPLLVGLAVVVPVLGHATWHLYRRLVG